MKGSDKNPGSNIYEITTTIMDLYQLMAIFLYVNERKLSY